MYFAETGAVLETLSEIPDARTLAAWRSRVDRVRDELGWPDGPILARQHRTGASLAFSAPIDQLLSATEVNEWAWLSAFVSVTGIGLQEVGLYHAPGHPSVWDDESALYTLRAFSQAERIPQMALIVDAAIAHGVSALVDEEAVSVGSGRGSQTWPIDALPELVDIDWSPVHDIPTALITGSNGKTTTVRLLSMIAREHGWHTAHSCTDGLFLDNMALEAGDYSGPGGARTLLRDRRADAAILETARGGMLRRGIASQSANVAVVTNISDDHFGEYGIHDLDDLASVKLTVARVLDDRAPLVLNAEDSVLVRHADSTHKRIAWFALDDDLALLEAHRTNGGWTCAVRAGRLRLVLDQAEYDLGAIDEMPLSFGGQATYNVANIAAAALAASALGIAPATIAKALSRFGLNHADNPGRLQHWRFADVQVFLDYAHNPEGLRGLLDVATREQHAGKLAIVLGQAGNRGDVEIRELAAVAASYSPALIVLKDLAAMMRGRQIGEIPALMRAALSEHGIAGETVIECLDETEAARLALMSAEAGSVVVLPIHTASVREHLTQLLDELLHRDWRAGQAIQSH